MSRVPCQEADSEPQRGERQRPPWYPPKTTNSYPALHSTKKLSLFGDLRQSHKRHVLEVLSFISQIELGNMEPSQQAGSNSVTGKGGERTAPIPASTVLVLWIAN